MVIYMDQRMRGVIEKVNSMYSSSAEGVEEIILEELCRVAGEIPLLKTGVAHPHGNSYSSTEELVQGVIVVKDHPAPSTRKGSIVLMSDGAYLIPGHLCYRWGRDSSSEDPGLIRSDSVALRQPLSSDLYLKFRVSILRAINEVGS